MVLQKGRSDILSLPCLISHQFDGKVPDGGSESTESKTGLVFFQPLDIEGPCYVLSVFTPCLERRIQSSKSGQILFGKNEKEWAEIYVQNVDINIKASPIIAWKSSAFANQLQKIFQPTHEWSLVHDDSGRSTKSNDLDEAELLSWFILYRIDSNLIHDLNRVALEGTARPLRLDYNVRPGTDVITRSYPFGPDVVEVFTDAMSSGIVSNMSRSDDGALFLIDARCLPGSEGGGVYTSSSLRRHAQFGEVIGMIVSPLCWKTQELVGMTVCCSVQEILLSLLTTLEELPLSPKSRSVKDFFEICIKDGGLKKVSTTKNGGMSPIVVRVDAGGIWGSGVVVAAKLKGGKCEMIVVSCGHVVEKATQMKRRKINVNFHEISVRCSATILFATDEESVYDLAILGVETENNILKDLLLNDMETPGDELHIIPHSRVLKDLQKGSPVFLKGYGLFDVESELGPTVSRGLLSNVVCHNGIPVLLHSTCLVHKGASGGALFCPDTGKLQGIVVNHVRDDDSKLSYPDVNFSVPANIFMPSVIKYLDEKDLSVFHCMNCKDNEVKRVWKMKPRRQNTSSKIRSKL